MFAQKRFALRPNALEVSALCVNRRRLPLAKQQEAVASAAHAAGTLDLPTLFAMRLEAKEAELDRLDLERRLALVDAYLTLEYGEALS